MFSGVNYESPPTTGKKMLGMPSATHLIQPRKTPASLLDGVTTTISINFNSESPRTKKSLEKSPLKTSFKIKNP